MIDINFNVEYYYAGNDTLAFRIIVKDKDEIGYQSIYPVDMLTESILDFIFTEAKMAIKDKLRENKIIKSNKETKPSNKTKQLAKQK